jgi:hypothetical protein
MNNAVLNIRVSAFLYIFLCFWFFEIGSGYVAQASLELEILLPRASKCWNYECQTQFRAGVSAFHSFWTYAQKWNFWIK